MITVLSSASARPNFVKLAAVHHALTSGANKGKFKHVIVHTGQHYDPLLSDVFFKQLEIADPAFNLGVKGAPDRETTIHMTADAMEPVLKKVKPNIVLVYGDVNGAVGAARAAKKLGIKVGHVEAGLRSFDSSMPEELNRIEIDGIADELFVTEQSAIDHLKKEKAKGNVHFVGNTMIDTLIRMKTAIDRAAQPFALPPLFGIATIHRPSNVDNKESLERTISFLEELALLHPLALPLHLRTAAALDRFGLRGLIKNLRIVEPLGYVEFLHILSKASFVITDSGGIQEEATFLKRRCFTLRKNTERPSTIQGGSNVLIDLEKEADRKLVLDFVKHPKKVDVKIPEKWDGKAGERIGEVLMKI